MLRYAQILVEGQAIHYATEGDGAPLLLLHPPPFDHHVWAPAIPYLSGHFRIVAPDLPGCGKSGAPLSDGGPDGLIRLAAGLTTALRMVPCVVVGISFGGAIALGLAARHPERVRGLVAVGSPGPQLWPATVQARFAKSARHVPGLLTLALRLAPQAQARWLARGMVGDRSLADNLAEQATVTLRTSIGRRAFVHIIQHVDDWRFVMRQLGGIRAPTLLIWGERDALYTLPAAERLRHEIPGARLITIAGAGNMLSIERPIELGAELRRFLLGHA
jgi:pimeloyl-ACP methyl ester carboxylesterase